MKGILNFAPVPIRIPVGPSLSKRSTSPVPLERVALLHRANAPKEKRHADMKSVETILKEHPNAGRDHLIPILQEVQESEGYLSQESITKVGEGAGSARQQDLRRGDLLQHVPLPAQGQVPRHGLPRHRLPRQGLAARRWTWSPRP